MIIVPTLLCQTKMELQAGMERWSGVVNTVQVDFADGVFVPSTLPGVTEFNELTSELQFEAHLMVQQPAAWVGPLLENPRVSTLLIHVEAEADIPALADQVQSSGRQFGLAVRPETAIQSLTHYLPLVDQILLLGVNPGFNGSPFLPEVIEKVRQLRSQWPGLIEVDGGIRPGTIEMVAEAGADQVAVGSFLQHGDARAKLAELEACV